MNRTERLVIRLNTAERAAIGRLAQAERLPVSTLARQMILREVDRRGLWSPVNQAAPRQVDQRNTEERMEVPSND